MMPLGLMIWKRANPSPPAKELITQGVSALAAVAPPTPKQPLQSQPDQYPRLQPRSHHTFTFHEVSPGETLESIGTLYAMTAKEIADLNPAIGRYHPGVRLKVFSPPEQRQPAAETEETHRPPARRRIPTQGVSHGLTNHGWLENGLQLPRMDDLYLRALPKEQYGTSAVIQHLIDAITELRTRHEYKGQIVIGDLSIKHGGHFPPHKSHQTGRDVDIWLPVRGSRQSNKIRPRDRPQPEQADWLATWHLIDALIGTGAIDRIFLSYHLQEYLRDAAIRDGNSVEELAEIIQYPARDPYAFVRHSPSHTRHIHVRFRCSMRDKQLGRPACED